MTMVALFGCARPCCAQVDVLDESASPQTLRYRPRIVISAVGLFPQTQPNRVALPGTAPVQQ